MRFDDRIATVMALPATQPGARAAKWRQLVDLLAQHRGEEISEEVDLALDWLQQQRSEIDVTTRQEIARSLAGRNISPLLFRFFAEDSPSIAAPLVANARLTVAQWIELLPTLTQTARSLVRNRRDLGPEVAQALASFGSSDIGIGGSVDASAPAWPRPAAANPAAEGGEAQIRELVARIEAFRKQRAETPPEPPLALDEPAQFDSFRWETGADGVIHWVDDAPRGPLVGQTIAVIAGPGQHGVDGQAAGAFEKRAPFRDARFTVAGVGPAAGDWRVSGVPFFHTRTGSFLGYRGSARRPRVDEVARTDVPGLPDGVFGTNLPADSLRQLVHELRTPLNAIIGFAEMIDGQYMGPAGARYRARAVEIMEQASRLLSAVDDLDTAARIETQRLSLGESSVDAVALLCRLHDAYERVASQRGAKIAIEIMQDLPAARAEPGTAERMFARMLAASIGLAQEGETIAASMRLNHFAGQSMLCLAIDRPTAIDGIDEAALLDPGYSPDGDWPGAPALGLGFALRLVRNLAEALGGSLEIGADRFFLFLPAVGPAELSSGQG